MKVNSQLERAQLENLTSLPSAATAGRVAWDSVAGKAFLDDATNWRAFLRNDQKAIIGNSGTAADNIRFHRGANGVLQVVSGADATAEGTLSTALNQLSFRAENYATGSLPTFGSVGRIAFDTTTGFPKFDTGAAWKEIVDSSSAQTITGKTLVSPTVNSALTGEQIATPSNPTSGFNKIYPKSDGKWYNLKSDGSEDPLGSGSGSGGINYITNPTADSNTLGWSTYADAAGALPVGGTGGSPASTLTRSTTTPLRGAASFLWTKSAANRQGEGFSYDFTIDAADKAKVLQISFDYFIASGTYADSDLTVYIYDVTNALVIQPSGYTIQNALVQMKQSATFQTASNSTSYRLIVHTASTSASAYSLQFDNFAVGPQIVTQGAAISDWVSFTPTGTWNTNCGYTGKYRRVGDQAEIAVIVNTTGAPNTANLEINLPPGLAIDQTKILSTNPDLDSRFGQVRCLDGGIAAYLPGSVGFASATSVGVYSTYAANNFGQSSRVHQASPFTFANGDYVSIIFSVPILGWSSNLQLSSDTDTRVVAAGYSSTSSPSIGNTATVIPFTTKTFDTHSAYNTSTGVYTVPVSGKYRVTSKITTSGTNLSTGQTISMNINKNGSAVSSSQIYGNGNGSGPAYTVWVSDTIDCISGDTLSISAFSVVATSVNSAPGYSTLSIERLSGPSTIAASETVAASYKFTSAHTPAGGSPLNYDVANFDTHSAVTTGSGWKYTAQIPGIYRLSVSYACNVSNGATSYVYKNGSFYQALVGASSIATGVVSASTTIKLLAGDYISHNTDNSVQYNSGTISIERIGN